MTAADSRRTSVAMAAVAIASGLAWLAIWQTTVPALRVVGGLLLAFVLPGLAATSALFPARAISRPERLVLTPGLSLALLVVGGLVLNVAGVKLTTLAWASLAALAGVTFAVLSFGRRWRARPVPEEDRTGSGDPDRTDTSK